jgi:hypothetical protein
MSSLRIVELHVIVSNMPILGLRRNCFFGKFMSPETLYLHSSSCKVSDIFVRL